MRGRHAASNQARISLPRLLDYSAMRMRPTQKDHTVTYTPDHDLLHYVNLLRQPHRTPHIQRPDDAPPFIGYSEHDGLLAQLRAAIVGGIGTHGGSSTVGSERLPFDASALQLYDHIETGIANLYVEAHQEPIHLEPERNLADWYRTVSEARSRGDITDELWGSLHTQVSTWVRAIEDKFNPWRQREWNAPCPECSELYAWDQTTGNRVRAIVMDYRENDYGSIEIGAITCRFCHDLNLYGFPGIEQIDRMITNARTNDATYVDTLVKNET